MNNVAQFGALTALCVMFALVADLVVTPAVIRILKPLGPEASLADERLGWTDPAIGPRTDPAIAI